MYANRIKSVVIKKAIENPVNSKLTNENSIRVGMGGTRILSDLTKILFTTELSSCYALIVTGKKITGETIVGLHHWVGDDDSAKQAINLVKENLKSIGGEEDTFVCYAIGGDIDFSDNTREINLLKASNIIHYALCNLSNEEFPSTDLTIKVNDENQVEIEYFTKGIAYKHTPSV